MELNFRNESEMIFRNELENETGNETGNEPAFHRGNERGNELSFPIYTHYFGGINL